jgi:hypothetical protein
VDPLADQPPEVRTALRDPSSLFPSLSPGELMARPFPRRDRCEYAKLVARQIRAGKIELASTCSASADIFAVGKSSGKLREVWSGGAISERAARPQKPPLLANPSPLLNLQATRDRPLHVYKRDARCYFDQLRVPRELRRWFGRPSLAVRDLLSLTDLTWAELLATWTGDGDLTGDSTVFPLSRSWPMGFSWSSFLAQTTLLQCCHRAGFRTSSFLALDTPTPCDLTAAVALATDDVALFTTLSKKAGDSLVGRIDDEIARRGIQAHRGKDVNYARDATVIGIDLCGGTVLAPQLDKLQVVMAGLLHLLTDGPPASPLEMSAINGQLAWLALLNRPLFSTMHATYRFAQSHDSVPRSLPAEVRGELWLFLALLPWCAGDLTRPWQHHIVASDASPSFGFGVSVTRAPPAVVEEVARTAARPATYVRLDRDTSLPGEEPDHFRLGREVKIPLRKSAFRHVISSRARFPGHAGTLEAEAVGLALRWILRSVSRHARRTTMLVDAKAVIGAMVRGRSSAPTLRRAVARSAALIIGGDLLVHFAYIPSEENAADAPSRGKCLPRRGYTTPVAGKWAPRRGVLKHTAPKATIGKLTWNRWDHQDAVRDHLLWAYEPWHQQWLADNGVLV